MKWWKLFVEGNIYTFCFFRTSSLSWQARLWILYYLRNTNVSSWNDFHKQCPATFMNTEILLVSKTFFCEKVYNLYLLSLHCRYLLYEQVVGFWRIVRRCDCDMKKYFCSRWLRCSGIASPRLAEDFKCIRTLHNKY